MQAYLFSLLSQLCFDSTLSLSIVTLLSYHFDFVGKRLILLAKVINYLVIISAQALIKQPTQFTNSVAWHGLLHVADQFRSLLSRAKKAAAFFSISLSLVALQSCFSKS